MCIRDRFRVANRVYDAPTNGETFEIRETKKTEIMTQASWSNWDG